MSDDSRVVPRIGVQGVAGGLVLMAFFTVLWGSWSLVGLPPTVGVPIIVVFALSAVAFAVEGIRLFRLARQFPAVDTTSRRAQTKSTGARFGIIFGLEGVLIGAASGVLAAAGMSDYINPVIALIVGLHFIPLARVFERTIDYYIAAWVVLAAGTGVVLLALTALPVYTVWTIVAIATACGTSAYGLYMLSAGHRLRDAAGHR